MFQEQVYKEKIKGDNVSRGTPLGTFPNKKKSAPPIRTYNHEASNQDAHKGETFLAQIETIDTLEYDCK
jgi:hypothetical protein